MDISKPLPDFPLAAKAVLQALKNEVAWLHAKHKIWRQLYDTDEQRIELMNEMAKSFFAVLQTVLIRDILLGIARLTDPHSMGRNRERQNLTLSRLLLLLKGSCPQDFHHQLTDQLAHIKSISSDFIGWRHRVLAHNDLPTALNRELVQRIERDRIKGALAEIASLMNQIEGYYFRSEMGYEHFLLDGDGETIIFYLEQAKAHDRDRLEAMAKEFNLSPDSGKP